MRNTVLFSGTDRASHEESFISGGNILGTLFNYSYDSAMKIIGAWWKNTEKKFYNNFQIVLCTICRNWYTTYFWISVKIGLLF